VKQLGSAIAQYVEVLENGLGQPIVLASDYSQLNRLSLVVGDKSRRQLSGE